MTTTARRPLRRILVANRGEIAVRIIRASRELGLEAIQAYSEADRDSLAVQMADESICIGPPPSTQSYLKGDVVIGAARAAKADAIHPGYGFLSENAAFAQACEDANIAFIGPPARAIALMGDKATARRMAAKAGVPITPGSESTVLTSMISPPLRIRRCTLRCAATDRPGPAAASSEAAIGVFKLRGAPVHCSAGEGPGYGRNSARSWRSCGPHRWKSHRSRRAGPCA